MNLTDLEILKVNIIFFEKNSFGFIQSNVRVEVNALRMMTKIPQTKSEN